MLVERPESFLEDELFGHQPHRVQARGFKLAFGHAREVEWEPVWRYLADQRTHVIQMERRNLLAAFLSLERARRSGEFVARTANDAASPIALHPEQCIKFFESVGRREADADELFADCPRLIVSYEDLVSDQDNVLRQVQDFLAVTPEVLTPQTKRQSAWDPAQQILNYDEVKSAFRDTPYDRFLDREQQA